MQPSVSLFGPVDALLAPYMEYVLLVLAVVNMGARGIEYRSHVQQAAEGGADAIRRHPLRVGTNVLLVVSGFYYMTLHHHSGMVISTLVLGVFITDLFEFESRRVEARQGWELERPKGAIGASVLVLLYAAFLSLFFLVEPVWSSIV